MERARPLTHAAAALVGVPLAFFLVFAGVFTDPGGLDERLVSLGLVATSYGLLGVTAGRLGGTAWAATSLVSTAVLILAWYTTREPQNMGLHALYLLAAVAPAVLAAGWGARRKRASGVESPPAPPPGA